MLHLSGSRRRNLYPLNLGKFDCCSLANQKKWNWEQIPPAAAFLGHRQLLPCRLLEQGKPIHTEQSVDKKFSCWEILVWNIGRRKREGTGCEKSSCCMCCCTVWRGWWGTQWPYSTIRASAKKFDTKMLPDQVYWNNTLIKALVDNELKQ